MDDQNPYQAPGEAGRQQPTGFTFRWGCWTQVFWVLAVLAGIALWDWLAMQLVIWNTEKRREREHNPTPNTTIVRESK